MTFKRINELWSIWGDAYSDWDAEKRWLFGQYLLYLRELSPSNTNDGAIRVLEVKNVRTLQRIINGEKVSNGTAGRFDALVLYFAKIASDGIEVDDFETWLHKRQASKKQDVADSEQADDVDEDRSSTEADQSASSERSKIRWLWWGGGSVLAVALVAIAALVPSACLLPGQCAPQDVGYLEIEADFYMRVNSGRQQSDTAPRITRLREPYFYVEADGRANFVDANISIIDRSNGDVLEKFEFEDDPRKYPEPYGDDEVTSNVFDFEVVECFAVHVDSRDVWVKEFRVKQPDAERLRDLVTQKRRDSFNLLTVFSSDRLLSKSQLECPEDIRTDPLYEAFQNSGAGQPLSEIASLYPEILEEPLGPDAISLDAGNIRFDGSWYGGYVGIRATISADLPAGTEFRVSQDGESFGWGLAVSNMKPEDRFIVRLTNPSWPKDAGPFDFTELAQATASIVVGREFGKNRDSIVRCEPGACSIANHTFCNGNWQKLSLARRPGEEEAVVNFTDCEPSNVARICLSTPIDLFPIAPGQSVFGALQSVGGDAYEFELSALPLTDHFQEGAPFVPLIALTKEAPPVFALYSVWGHSGSNEVRYDMAVAAKGCSVGRVGFAELFKAVYYDVDGKGNVRGDVTNFWIPEPEREFIEITLEGKDSKIYGPYRYAFPSENIINSSIARIERASTFECRRKLADRFDARSWEYYCFAPSTYQSVFEWADVAEVQIGTSPDDLSTVIPVDLSNREIVERHGQTRQGVAPPVFEHSPSREQRDLYFSIVYKDGKRTLVQRLQLPDPL